jgi:hypothetical protein
MLLSHEKKFIFLKTYKTGSSSIESVLREFCGKIPFDFDNETDNILGKSIISDEGIITFPRCKGVDEHHFEKNNYWDHMSAKEIKNKIGSKIWNEYFKFCVVRNPYSKLISLLYFLTLKWSVIGENVEKKWLIDIVRSDFRKKLYSEKDDYFSEKLYCIDNKIAVDYIVRYENYYDDLEKIFNRLDITFNKNTFPRINSEYADKNIKEKDFLTKDMIEYVKEHSKFELENFGYTIPI